MEQGRENYYRDREKRNRRNALMLLTAFVLAVMGTVMVVLWTAARTKAEAPKYTEDETTLALAQQCVAEVDFNSPAECWLMWHINLDLTKRRQARDPSWHLVDQLRAYNSAFRKTRSGRYLLDTPRTSWVRELNLEGTQPPSWRTPYVTLSWPPNAEKWQGLVELARKFVQDPGRHPCPLANAYGGDCSNPKGACDAVPTCWVRISCAVRGQAKPLVQAYYRGQRCADEQTTSRSDRNAEGPRTRSHPG